MSQYWHFGLFPPFSSAPRVELLKMVFMCFKPQPLLIKGLKALGCFYGEAQRPSPLRTGGTIFGVNTFGATNPLFRHNGPNLNLPLNVSPEVVCARYPRLRAIGNGYKNPP